MPASRVTTSSPWHLTLVVHAPPDQNGAQKVRDALEILVEEMTLLSGGVKPLFKVTVIDGGRDPHVAAEAASDVEASDIICSQPPSGAEQIKLSALLASAHDVLSAHPGREDDFTPYVLVLTAGADCDANAIAAAERLKSLALHAGTPRLVVFDFSNPPTDSLRRLASRDDLYVALAQPEPVVLIFPPTGSAVANVSGEAEVDQLVSRLSLL